MGGHAGARVAALLHGSLRLRSAATLGSCCSSALGGRHGPRGEVMHCSRASLPLLPPQGDHNPGDDRILYPKGQLWLNTDHIMGKVVG